MADIISPCSGTPPTARKHELQLRVINFVYSNLVGWRDDQARKKVDTENALTSQLVDFLNSQTELFVIKYQEPQGIQGSIDLAIKPKLLLIQQYNTNFTIYTPILLIEAKRLPAPSEHRKSEYVTGRINSKGKIVESGGIQRFKIEKHGIDETLVAMIGYIQNHDANFFYNSINQCIDELTQNPIDGLNWCKSEKLQPFIHNDPSKGIAKTKSTHICISQKNIEIYHLWINLNN